MSTSGSSATKLLRPAGDRSALDDLIPLVYHELHRKARIRLSGESHNQILQPTALVNETVVRLLDWRSEQWRDRAHFLGVCATLMRSVAVEYARQQYWPSAAASTCADRRHSAALISHTLRREYR